MPSRSSHTTKYYRDYYFRTKELRKFQYYEKKDREEENKKQYEAYGGEKAYYTQMMKKWCSTGEI